MPMRPIAEEGRVAVTVRLPQVLHQKMQDEAHVRNVSMNTLMLEAMATAEELEGLVPKLYLYDCDRGQGAVYVHSLEEACRIATRLNGSRSGPPRSVHLATIEETAEYVRSIEEACRAALLDSGRSDPLRNARLATATAEETAFRKAMGGSTS